MFFQTQWLMDVLHHLLYVYEWTGWFDVLQHVGYVYVLSRLGKQKNVKKQILRVVLSFYLVKRWSLLFLSCSILEHFFNFFTFCGGRVLHLHLISHLFLEELKLQVGIPDLFLFWVPGLSFTLKSAYSLIQLLSLSGW